MIMMNKYKAIITVLLLNTTLLMSQKYETQEYKTVSQIDNIEIITPKNNKLNRFP